MPDAKPKQSDNVPDLEKKVDEMMAPDVPESKDTSKGTAEEPSVKESEPILAQSPTGVPEVPKELAKDLDAFSVDAPDISDETDEPKQGDVPSEVAENTTEQTPATESMPTQNAALDDPATDEAVTDIVREESDELLQVEDAASQEVSESAENEPVKKRHWWRSKKFVYSTVFVLLVAVAIVMAWPTTRYVVLNTAGVRSKASIKVTDNSTKLPLSNVEVRIGGAKAKTDDKGIAAFDMVKLGKQPLVIDRVAFAKVERTIVVGWGSNPLGEIELDATGARYELKVTDFVSGKPLQAEASNDSANAMADKNGVIKLVIDDINKQTVEITVQTEGYRTEKVTVAANKKGVTNVVMVPSKPVVYVSKQSGKYDVYSIDADGKNKKVLLAGTGRENQDIKLAVSPDGSKAAVVSTRGTKRDSYGNLLQTLTLIDIKSTSNKTLDDASSIALVDWAESRLVYVANYAGNKDVSEQRLVSYDANESARSALATSTYFGGVASIGGYIYFASISEDPAQTTAFQKVRVDGTGKQTILQQRVLSSVRTDYAQLRLETPDGWYAYKIGNDEATKADPPEAYTTRQYKVSPNGTQSVWLDNRDGKGTIVLRNQNTDKETVFAEMSGLGNPLRWLNDTTIVYRVANLNETADYVKSTRGGEAKKITNVTNTTGLSINF